jgi:Fe-S oxidoreductase
MLTLLVAFGAAFFWSVNRRFQLLTIGRPVNALGDLGARIQGTLEYAFAQRKMGYYPLAGFAHKLIFGGFLVLLFRTLVLWGRGFDPAFSLWVLGPTPTRLPFLGAVSIGHGYDFLKDVVATLVVAGACVFIYLRVIKRERRMTLSGEGLVILGIIVAMMLADIVYDGACIALFRRGADLACIGGPVCERIRGLTAHFVQGERAELRSFRLYPSPAGTVLAAILDRVGPQTLSILALVGFWTHSSLVLIFANILPYSKHFHILTAIPNVFARPLAPRGQLPLVALSAEEVGERVMRAADAPDAAEPVGVARIEDFTWKELLDLYTCTECGRCSDNCPAHTTGKLLSPKQLTLDLRDHLYGRQTELLSRPGGPRGHRPRDVHASGEHSADQVESHGGGPNGGASGDPVRHAPEYPANPIPGPPVLSTPVDLVSNVIHPDVLWGCTTCRACEEQCPVMITYVDKIVNMRRNLVLVKGELPGALVAPFQALEVNGNPWNLARMDRGRWADGLGVPTMAEKPSTPVLFWAGCAASYDDRAKRVARSVVSLLQAAGVEVAILGTEETCTGDFARRAGNEHLFATLAEQNVATLNGYRALGGLQKIVTTCPHCFNTLKNEYPAFGGKFEVAHHTELLAELLARKKLVPKQAVDGAVVYHDSCYLGRYNDVYESPREIIRQIPGATLMEPTVATRSRGLCCGAGGGQMWMEEQNQDRINVKRTLQLLEPRPKTVATACPFCQTMLTDGLKATSKDDEVRGLDVAELLAETCLSSRGTAHAK